MKILRAISLILRDIIKNEGIREKCKVQNMIKWAKVIPKGWGDHVDFYLPKLRNFFFVIIADVLTSVVEKNPSKQTNYLVTISSNNR